MLNKEFIINNFKQGDKVELTIGDTSKQGTYHHFDEESQEIWIKQYGKKKACWVICLNDIKEHAEMKKISKFTSCKKEVNFNIFH